MIKYRSFVLMLKKLIIIGTSLLLIQFNLFAGDGKSYIGLKGGVSFPMGEYSSQTLNKGSFTTTGFSMGVEGVWFFYKNFGAGLDFNFSLHPVDASALATATVIDDPVMEDLTIRSDPYNIKTYMVGIHYYIPITSKFNITPKIQSGIMYGRTPYQLYEAVYFMFGPRYFKITESRDHRFAVKGGINAGYNINGCINIGLNIDYTYSKLIFGFQTSSGLETRQRRIGYLDISVNLIIKL